MGLCVVGGSELGPGSVGGNRFLFYRLFCSTVRIKQGQQMGRGWVLSTSAPSPAPSQGSCCFGGRWGGGPSVKAALGDFQAAFG